MTCSDKISVAQILQADHHTTECSSYVIFFHLPPPGPLLECSEHQFACADQSLCISMNWKCDGEPDCKGDQSDEDPIECGQ